MIDKQYFMYKIIDKMYNNTDKMHIFLVVRKICYKFTAT